MKSYRWTILQKILPLVEKPSRYIGREWNSIQKNPSRVKVKVALAFPDIYEIGMSHLGLKILYYLLNKREDVVAERVYAPWFDFEGLLNRKRVPLCTLESGIPLHACDILGFTLQYELSYTNILQMLYLSGIPLLSEERGENHPLVIAGGPSAFNPEPLADFIDLFVIGDGEEAIFDLLDLWLDWRGSGGRRDELLVACSGLPGFYVPRFYKGGPIEKRMVDRLGEIDQIGYMVPFMEIVHDRYSLEVMRGCTRGCRFCQAGYIYRPLRERPYNEILEGVLHAVRRTGYEEASLSSLSLSDLSCLPELLPPLMASLSPEMVSLSLPSLRPEGLREETVWQVQKVRKTGFTIAPEAGTERLRSVINKPMEEKDFFGAIEAAAKAGWDSVKLYFMVGLPTEEWVDLDGIRRLVKEGAKIARKASRRGFNLTVSVSPFVPKPHTPFQWVGQESREILEEKLRYLKDGIREARVSFKWHRVEQSFLEAAFSRGDRALGRVLLDAWKRGCRFDGWTDQLRFPLWEEAFSACGLDPSHFANRSLAYEEPLPWDHILTGVSKEFLYRECRRALNGQFTPDCHIGPCLTCGLPCAPDWREWTEKTDIRHQTSDHRPQTTDHRHQTTDNSHWTSGISLAPSLEGREPSTVNRQPTQRIQVKFRKTGELRFLSHLELQRAFSRALRRARIPVAYSMGYNPQPRLSIASPLPVGIEGTGELLDLRLSLPLSPQELLERLNLQLPRGLRWIKAWEVSLKEPSLESQVQWATYLVRFDMKGLPYSQLSHISSTSNCSLFLDQEGIWVEAFRKGEKFRVNTKAKIRAFRPIRSDNGRVCFELSLFKGKIRPYEVMKAYIKGLLPDMRDEDLALRILIRRVELGLKKPDLKE